MKRELFEAIAPAAATEARAHRPKLPNTLLDGEALRREYGLPWTDKYIRKLVARGEFIEPVYCSANTVRFRRHDVERWIASRPTLRQLKEAAAKHGEALAARQRAGRAKEERAA